MRAMDLAEAFGQQFPISTEYYSLEFIPESVDENTGEVLGGFHELASGNLAATLRFFVWEVNDGARSIRDIKEQQVFVVPKAHVDDARVPAYFAGWAAAVRFVFERHDERRAAGDQAASQRLDWAMPHELVFSDILGLRRPQTADEFTDALLSGKKRLGRLLP